MVMAKIIYASDVDTDIRSPRYIATRMDVFSIFNSNQQFSEERYGERNRKPISRPYMKYRIHGINPMVTFRLKTVIESKYEITNGQTIKKTFNKFTTSFHERVWIILI